MRFLHIIGGGLAGSEAAWQAASRGIPVRLSEMRPTVKTEAHNTDLLAELVCSNSLRSNSLDNAVGVLKEEMRMLNSLIMAAADKHALPAGGALAVDREGFSAEITDVIANHPLITLVREEVTDIPSDEPVIVASGPLTSPILSEKIAALAGSKHLYFYDAAAPIVTLDSIDFSIAFKASRYGKGSDDYINCPMTAEEYDRFYQELVTAETHPLREFEKPVYFEGCMPVEVMAKRGRETILYGPLKPVGLVDPRTGREPYAVVQLRQDNAEGTLWNMVGFQTNLKWGEQKRVFRLIPGLAQAEFVRYGFIHRNTFINSPDTLLPTLQWKTRPDLFFAGQITGVEGYVESAAAGLVAGINAARLIQGKVPLVFPRESVIGSLCHYITSEKPAGFQPMKANFGLLPVPERVNGGKRARKEIQKDRALAVIRSLGEI